MSWSNKGKIQLFIWVGRQKLEINKLFVVLVQKVILVILGFNFGPTTLQLIINSLTTQSTSDVHHKRRKLRRN